MKFCVFNHFSFGEDFRKSHEIVEKDLKSLAQSVERDE